MQSNKLQLMIYGQDISPFTEVTIESVTGNSHLNKTSVKVVSVETTDNPNYLFLNLDLNKTKPAVLKLVFKKQSGETLAPIHYELKQRSKNSQNRKGFAPKDVVYLITPDRFV